MSFTYFRLRLGIKKHQQKIVLMISAVILLLNILSIYAILTSSRISNDECIWYPVKSTAGTVKFIFRDVKPGGVTELAGIRNGDTLLYINGKACRSSADAQQIINGLPEGDFALYTVAGKDSVFVTKVEIKKLISFELLSFSLMAFFWFFVGFIMILAKPEGEVQQLFFKIGVGFSILRSFPIFIPFLPGISANHFFIGYLFFAGIAGTLFPYWIIEFFSLFPNRIAFTSKKLYRYFLRGVTAVIMTINFVRLAALYIDIPGTASPREINILNLGYFFGLVNIFSIAALFNGLIFLLINYALLKDRQSKKPIKVIVLAYLLAALSMIYSGVIAPRLGYVVYNSPEFFMPVIAVVLLPIAFGYSIFRYQLFDVGHVVKVSIAYGTATVLLGAVYLLTVFSLGKAIGAVMPEQYQGLMTLLFFIIFAFIFQPTKDKFQDVLTKRFYPEQDAYQKEMIHLPQEMAKTVGLENILNVIQNLFVKKIRIERFCLLLTGSDEGEYIPVRTSNFPVESRLFRADIPRLRALLAEKQLTGRRQVIEEEEFPDVFPAHISEFSDCGIFTVVPMQSGQKTVGFFLLGLKFSGSKFVGRDLDLLTSVSIQSAIAIENARLYLAEMEKLRLEQDLAIAREIQTKLLPHEMPRYKNFDIWGEMIPALQVGGDYFDLIPYREEGLFIIIGDVSGKGLSASLYMSKIQTLVRLWCANSDSPREILIELNTQLATTLDIRTFATMTIAYIDFGRHSMRISRAGHVPLMLRDGTDFRELTPPGIALGLDRSNLFKRTLREVEVPLKKGQVFLFYSDGFDEARNEHQEFFGKEPLSTALGEVNGKTSKEIASGIIHRVKQFQGRSSQYDDMTLVLLRILN